AGTSREETLSQESIRGGEWRASLRTLSASTANAAVPAAWTLTLESAKGEKKELPVSDFASVSNIDDPSNWFSLWF
ncbi:MAG: hypothetical protein IJ829_02570, partial [Kiritimatiellae bacterium]|nr:hypothetical protein [Kiritimatiellia bacterium]